MPDEPRSAFSYAIVRVVPRVERGEGFNAGVVLFCRRLHFLGARVALDRAKLLALAPDLSPKSVLPHLEAVVKVAEGAPDAGPIARLEPSERFGWLVAPASTIIQTSSVHTGLCEDPGATLEQLFDELVT